jgi:hypothetical protein
MDNHQPKLHLISGKLEGEYRTLLASDGNHWLYAVLIIDKENGEARTFEMVYTHAVTGERLVRVEPSLTAAIRAYDEISLWC